MSYIELEAGQKFANRGEISQLLGGNPQSGIVLSNKIKAILLFKNQRELYSDYFYPRGTYKYCLYTGIGRIGHQDSVENSQYGLNLAVLSHKQNKMPLLLFEKQKGDYYFRGEYRLLETHQNVQPDDNDFLRRVFIFHLKKKSDLFSCQIVE